MYKSTCGGMASVCWLAGFVWAASFLCGCQNGTPTGQALVELHVDQPHTNQALRGVLTGIVDSIRITVSDRSRKQLVQDTFDYETYQAAVSGIPAGGDRIFTVDALADHTVVYSGETDGVIIVADRQTSVRVDLVPAYTDDVYPPAAVTDLAAQVGADGVTLSWTATGNDGRLGTAAAYEIRYATENLNASNFLDATPAPNPPDPAASGTVEHHTLTDLAAGETWYFALRVTDADGNTSGLSNVATASLVDVDATPPADIVDLAVAADGLGEHSVTLVWTAPGDDGNQGVVTDYDVYYATAAFDDDSLDIAIRYPFAGNPVTAGQTETATIQGLLTGQSYHFGVRATDDAGNHSHLSNLVSARPELQDAIPPDAVDDLRVIAHGLGSVTLGWGRPADNIAVVAYDLRWSEAEFDPTGFDQLSDRAAPVSSGASESFTVDSLTANATYHLALKALDAAGNASAMSNVVICVTSDDITPPAAIADLRMIHYLDTGVYLRWTVPADAAEYDFRFSQSEITTQNFANATVLLQMPPVNPAGDQDTVYKSQLQTNVTYWFAIKSRDAARNWSAISNIVMVTPADNTEPPPAIQDLLILDSDINRVTLGWSPPPDDPGLNGSLAESYSVRYHSERIDAGNWDEATEFAGSVPAPGDGGNTDTIDITGLDTTNQEYWFAVRSTDVAGNTSGISNPAGTDEVAPDACGGLSASQPGGAGTAVLLAWDAPGDDGSTGVADHYIVKQDSAGAITDEAAFADATTVIQSITPANPGTGESLDLGILAPGSYDFAVRAVDDAGNEGPYALVTFAVE